MKKGNGLMFSQPGYFLDGKQLKLGLPNSEFVKEMYRLKVWGHLHAEFSLQCGLT